MISDEKRAFKRAGHKFTLKYRSGTPNGTAAGLAVTENLSMGGTFFVSMDMMEIGHEVDIVILMPDGHESKWMGRVVRCEEYGHGMVKTYGVAVEFTRAVSDAERRLRDALKA
ncbi:MAG: PilZ domain-containing protein [Candidatus Omnitrophica bacterium]|nr:PilZ domain-containing protein [Candidatus Omnitrophota bacterium]MDD5487965.1 PilZ domain-containing protein [Candidatus Omnitrophota bacterium]